MFPPHRPCTEPRSLSGRACCASDNSAYSSYNLEFQEVTRKNNYCGVKREIHLPSEMLRYKDFYFCNRKERDSLRLDFLYFSSDSGHPPRHAQRPTGAASRHSSAKRSLEGPGTGLLFIVHRQAAKSRSAFSKVCPLRGLAAFLQ